MLEYTFQVLRDNKKWSDITAVALALVEEDTLTYERVHAVIEQNRLNPVIT